MKRILWAIILPLLPTCADACQCLNAPICSAYWTSPVIFRGKVIEQTLLRPAPQSDEDLRWMRRLSKAPAGANIFGTIIIPCEGNESTGRASTWSHL
jgi:hypothetical protein